MAGESDHLATVTALAGELEAAGFPAVLVGGMALIIMGSQRVTMDFDLLVGGGKPRPDDLVAIMYRRNLELVTKFGPAREVIRTVDTPGVAVIKLKSQDLDSASFFNWKSRLRVDLLLDFPVPAHTLVQHAVSVSIATGSIRVACREDLIRLKEIARKGRKKASDAQDLEFLRGIAPA